MRGDNQFKINSFKHIANSARSTRERAIEKHPRKNHGNATTVFSFSSAVITRSSTRIPPLMAIATTTHANQECPMSGTLVGHILGHTFRRKSIYIYILDRCIYIVPFVPLKFNTCTRGKIHGRKFRRAFSRANSNSNSNSNSPLYRHFFAKSPDNGTIIPKCNEGNRLRCPTCVPNHPKGAGTAGQRDKLVSRKVEYSHGYGA